MLVKRSSMNAANSTGSIFSRRMTGPALIEGAFRGEHPIHQRRLRSGEDVADLTLILNRRAQRMLDRAAVEGGHRLEFVERDGQPLPARARDTAGQRKDLGGQPCRIACGLDRRK